MGRKILILIVAYCFVHVVCAKSHNDGFNELWQEAYLYKELDSKLSFAFLFNNMSRHNIGIYDWFLEGSIRYKLKPWFKLETMLRQEYYKINQLWVYETRPMLRLSFSKKSGIWNVRNRHRMEARFFQFGHSRFRYRSDVKLKLSVNWTKLKLNPYMQEEMFIADNRLSRIRSYIGFQGNCGWFEPGFYFLIQSNGLDVNKWISQDWYHRGIIGLVCGIKL